MHRCKLALLHPVLLALVLVGAPAEADSSVTLEPLQAERWTRADAAHLLRRAGFGGTPDEVDRLYALGLEGAVDYLVNYESVPFNDPPPALPGELLQRPDRAEARKLTEEQRRQLFQKRRQAHRKAFEETRAWWVERMARSPRPLEEKLTLFWSGHFTSGMRKVRNAVFMQEQNELLRENASGSFATFLLQISKDRAMLAYLDGNRNNKRQPNENYARELLELFSLGVGNYSEQDIKAAARAFTGWSYDEEGFQFRRQQHDSGGKQFLGKRGNFNGNNIIDIILEQRECSEFVARKLLTFFVRPDPDKRLVAALGREIRKNDYKLKPALKTLFMSRAFYDDEARGSLVKSPTELLLGAARQLDLPIRDARAAVRLIAGMGQELMEPPNVKGWPGGTHWINTAMLYKRYNAIGALLATTYNTQSDRPELLASNDEVPAVSSGELTANDNEQADDAILATLRKRDLDTPAEVVDFYASQLLARPLDSRKRDALVTYLSQAGATLNLADRKTARQIRMTLHLLCSSPEFQLN